MDAPNERGTPQMRGRLNAGGASKQKGGSRSGASAAKRSSPYAPMRTSLDCFTALAMIRRQWEVTPDPNLRPGHGCSPVDHRRR